VAFVVFGPRYARGNVDAVIVHQRRTVANAVIDPVSADGDMCLYSNQDAHLVADIDRRGQRLVRRLIGVASPR